MAKILTLHMNHPVMSCVTHGYLGLTANSSPLNMAMKASEKALATIDVAKSLLFETDYPGYALGILISKAADGTTGTVVIMGPIGPNLAAGMTGGTSKHPNAILE